MPQKEKLLICLREVLSFHRPRHGRINSKPKKVIYGTLYQLASKKEETEFLNTMEETILPDFHSPLTTVYKSSKNEKANSSAQTFYW